MSNIDKQALRTDMLIVNALETAKQLRELQESPVAESIFESIVENENGKEIQFERPISDLAYAAFLKIESLVEALEAAERSIAELEHSETQLINERDSAESAVMGQAPEWSNWFSFENAIDEIELACELWRNQTDDVIQFRQRIQELEAKLETADKLQDGAFRDGLKAGFSYGQTDDQSGFTQCMSAYSNAGIKAKES